MKTYGGLTERHYIIGRKIAEKIRNVFIPMRKSLCSTYKKVKKVRNRFVIFTGKKVKKVRNCVTPL